MAVSTTTDTSTLNSLMRGEMSAIETYRQAIEKLGDVNDPNVEKLRAIQRDHRDAADALWSHIEKHGGKPSEGSGPWGAFAQAVEGTAKVFGNASALKALKEGEEHGLKTYQDALNDKDLARDCVTLIQGLIPKQQAHISTVDQLINIV